MKTPDKSTLLFLSLAGLIYALLTTLCWNNVFFFDNIQVNSIEAHWFYLSNFATIQVPKSMPGLGAYGTAGPPLLPLITAMLWKLVAYKVWVSHAFTLLWAIILFFNVLRLVQRFFPEKHAGWVSFLILMETTLLAQYSIAPPDFILYTAFVMSLRSIFERKNWLLTIGFFFLLGINMRGVFTGCILASVHFFYYFYSKKEFGNRSFIKTFWPYIPAFLIAIGYFTNYFTTQGWFFTNSKFAAAHGLPSGAFYLIKHFCDLGMRLIENGRLIIWIIAIYVAWKLFKTKTRLSADMQFILTLLALLTGLYVIFVFITKMPFLTRYFMPQILLLTIFGLTGLLTFINERKLKHVFILILCFELTGHFWIYPEKTTVIWDSTLAHLPYYQLREECFDFIDQNHFDYNEISGGFCFYDDRRFVELKNAGKIIGRNRNRKYFIYSNISNIEDEWIDDFHNTNIWKPIKSFNKGFVSIVIYQNLKYTKQ